MENVGDNCEKPKCSGSAKVSGQTADAKLTDGQKRKIADVMSSASSNDSDVDDVESMMSCEIHIEESSDDELERTLLAVDAYEGKKRPKNMNQHMEEEASTYTEKEFKCHFRIPRELFNSLAKRINDADWYQKIPEDKRIPATTYLGVFLCFAGEGAYDFKILSKRFGLNVATINHIIVKMAIVISSWSPEIITWPNDEKKAESAKKFCKESLFSKAIGCIHVIRVGIEPPRKNEENYLDDIGNPSICLQAVCDENSKFIDAFVGYPGASPNNLVFEKSRLGRNIASACGDYYLLGGSAYKSTQHLITPFKNNGHLTTEQINHNKKIKTALGDTEFTFDFLKQRFPQLWYCKLKGIKIVCHFIISCCVIHNLAIKDETDYDFSIPYNESEDYCEDEDEDDGNAEAIRDAFCREMMENNKNNVE